MKKRILCGAFVLVVLAGGGLALSNATSTNQVMAMDGGQELNSEPRNIGALSNLFDESHKISTGWITLDSGQTIYLEYYFDEVEQEMKANFTINDFHEKELWSTHSQTGRMAEITIINVIGKGNYAAWVEQLGLSLTNGFVHPPLYIYIEAEPTHENIAKDTAITTAIEMLAQKFMLSQETLDRFTITARFYAVYENVEQPVWWVLLCPTSPADFLEIGTYWALVDGKTGEIVGLFSAEDGRG